MSETVSRGRRWVALGVVVVAAAGAVAGWRAGVFSRGGSPGSGPGGPPPATELVVRGDLSSTVPVAATLGYAGSYPVAGRGGGTLTWLPSPGQVIGQGQVLYRVDDGLPVVLLYGAVPDWRDLAAGVTGQDVSQLNHDLVALGDAGRADVAASGWDFYSWATAAGVQRLESAAGASSPSGSLPVGRVVFEPEALRVAQLTGVLGGPASGPVLAATSDRHVVTIPLSSGQESQVAVGDAVSVTLPGGASTPGTVASVGTVASGAAGNATVPVTVTLTHGSAAGALDQAPVTVYLTTGSVRGVLAVPVTALVAQAGGGYVVEVAGPGGARRWVAVTPGPVFDDATGLVQVTGNLAPGQRVVVASS